MFCIYLRINSDLCHLHHKLIGFYNRDEKCLLRGTNWVFKKNSLRLVFKGLILATLILAGYFVLKHSGVKIGGVIKYRTGYNRIIVTEELLDVWEEAIGIKILESIMD